MAQRTGIPLQSVVAVSFSELFGKQPTLEDASSILRNYERTSVLVMLGKLSAVLKTWQVRPNFAADRDLAARVFLDAGRREFQQVTDDAQRAFFPRVAILATARLALIVCPATGEGIKTPLAAAHILKVCMMMNELVSPGGADSTLEFVAHHLPYHNGFIAQRFQADMVRSLAMFEQAGGPSWANNGSLNFAAEFEQSVGLTPRRFAEFAVLVGSLYLPITGASFIVDDPSLFLSRNHFSATTLSTEQIDAFLSRTAKTDAELAQWVSSRGDRPLSDTTVFQNVPLIRMPDGTFFCIDLAALLDCSTRRAEACIGPSPLEELPS